MSQDSIQDPSLSPGGVLPTGISSLLLPSTLPSSSLNFFSTDSLSSSPSTGAPAFAPLSFSSPTLASGRLSILDFSKVVNTALSSFKQVSNQTDADLYIQDKKFWYDLASLTDFLVRLRALTAQQEGQETSIFLNMIRKLIDFNQTDIKDYNNTLDSFSSITNQMYNNQLTYINGPQTPSDTATYNSQVDNWNSNVDLYNTQLQDAYNQYLTNIANINSQIDAYNAQVDQENAQRQALGITTSIPHLNNITNIAPAPPTLPHISNAPPAPTSPTVPSGIPEVPNIPTGGVVDTTVTLTSASPAETNFYTGLQSSIDVINVNQLSSLNKEIATTENATNQLYQATLAYQNGGSVTDYNTAVSNYLAYANAENPTLQAKAQAYIAAVTAFNNNLDNVNQQIDSFNAIRAQNNLPLLPHQVPLPVPKLSDILLPTNITPGPPPPTNTPQQFIPLIIPNALVGSITPTSQTAYLVSYYSSLYQATLTGMTDYIKSLTLTEAYHDFQMFNLRGISNTIKAFIAQAPEIFLSPSPSSAVSGTSLTSNILGLFLALHSVGF